jgi:prophage regulatory protein
MGHYDMSTQSAFWRLPRVESETGYKRSSIYRLVKIGEFPAPVKIGERAAAWLDTEIQEWKAKRIAQSRKAA